ncbi:MAG: hypothetical protein N3A62_04120 [Thermodesulfovibrionales bacterium]|nr:hypothetical protein [Thermodesulfovibrionales bacterium]
MLKYRDKPIKEPLHLFKVIKIFFLKNTDLKDALQPKAQKILSLINGIDGIIQNITSSVCINCTDICCKNKHSYYELSDIIYLCLIQEELPTQRNDLLEMEPCQFLSKNGCILKRYKRPFRCNWYFCTDLINFVGEYGKRQGRTMTDTMQLIINTRNEIIETFFEYINSSQNTNIQLTKVIIETTS